MDKDKERILVSKSLEKQSSLTTSDEGCIEGDTCFSNDIIESIIESSSIIPPTITTTAAIPIPPTTPSKLDCLKADNQNNHNHLSNTFDKKHQRKLKIRIINKEDDYSQECTFQDFIQFSNKLIQERSTSIKNSPSTWDLLNLQNTIVKVNPNSPNPQHHHAQSSSSSSLNVLNKNNVNNIPTTTTTTTTTTSTTPSPPLPQPEGAEDNIVKSPTTTTTPTTPRIMLNDTMLKSPRTSTMNQLKSLSSNTFYLNHNPDFINSTNSLLEFSNHQRYNSNTSGATLKNRKDKSTIDEGIGGVDGDDGDDYDDIIKNKAAAAKLKEQPIYWIDLEGLSDDEISMICNLYSIHHLTFEDITSEDSTEKCEEFSNYTFISTSETIYSYTELVQSNVYMVQYSTFVLVFHEHPLDAIEDVLGSFRYLTNGQLSASEWIVATFFESFNEIYSELSDQLMKEVNVLDEFTLSEDAAHHSELYVRLGKATRKSTNLLSWIFIKNDILSSLIRLNQNKDVRIHLSNIKDRTVRLKQKIKMAEELLENISNLYISKVSLVLNEESHALNISMRKFSSLSVIFMPLNLIASIFGMNLRLPGEASEEAAEDDVGNYAAFISLMVIMIAMGTIITLFFKKLDWL